MIYAFQMGVGIGSSASDAWALDTLRMGVFGIK